MANLYTWCRCIQIQTEYIYIYIYNIKKERDDSHKLSFVLHISPMTFLGVGSSGPLSRCPEVK